MGQSTAVLQRRSLGTDMTEGSIIRHFIVFAMPLLAGNLFQQLYNTVDTWVVGNYVGNAAFSAVGSVGPITNMLIGFFSGLASGAGVVISQYFGAKKYDKVEKSVHTSIVMTLLLALAFTVIGLGMTTPMLHLMKATEDVFPEARTYLLIYFGGVSGLMVYNMGSGILRAVGDSRRPFYFLVVSALTNIFLDLLFVIRFRMGVAGVAYATVISQYISAILVVIVLLGTSSCVKVRLKKLCLDTEILGQIVRVGIPAALQMTITSFSNVFVASYINFFGTNCMSGWSAYSKIDQFMFLPMQSLALAATTFVGQNLGRGQMGRARKGVTVSLTMAITSTVIIMIPVMLFAPALVQFFNSDPQVVEYGTMFLRLNSAFYLVCCVNQVYAAAQRGAGNAKVPMVLMLFSFVLFRQAYLYIVANFISNTEPLIGFGYPAGWIVCSILNIAYYAKVGLCGKVVGAEETAETA